MKQYCSAIATASHARSLACKLLLSSLLAGCTSSIGTGDGKVIDFVSREPIPHATVTLTCTVPRIVHGSDKKIVETTSAADGSYRVDPARLRDCDFYFARALKPGYALDHLTNALTNPGPDTSRQIPKIVYLIKESDQPMVLLERVADFLPVASPAAGPYAAAEFGGVYKRFIASRRIAASPHMAAWVREKYCARLQAGWKVLTKEQRAGLNDDDRSPIDWSPVSVRPDSYEKEVQPYCGA